MKKLLPLFALLVLALPLCGRGVDADVPANPQAFVWSSGSPTSATGTLGPFSCPNANTGTFTFTSGGGASFTVKTAADTAYSAAYTTATSFGTSGVITAPDANTQSSGALGSSAVLYVEATYTGNSGTISGTFTCSASTTGSSGPVAISSLPPPVQPSPLYTQPVTTPAPAATNASDSGINVHIVGPTPLPVTTGAPYVAPTCPAAPNAPCVQITGGPVAVTTTSPLPTVSPGGAPYFTEVGPSPGAQTGFTGPSLGSNIGAIDSNGHRAVNVCSATAVTCVGVGAATNSFLFAGILGYTQTKLTAASGTCTLLSTSATTIYGVMYASASAQTGTLTIYNESIATCAAADAVYVAATHGVASVPDVVPLRLATGVVYQWTTAAEVGSVYLLTF